MAKENAQPDFDHVGEVINLLRYGGFNVQPQAVIVALDDEFLKLIRKISSMLEKDGEKLSLKSVKNIVEAFNEQKAKEAEAEAAKAQKPSADAKPAPTKLEKV